MVQLVGDSGWSRTPAWPAGVRDGDVAVVARSWTSQSGVGYPNAEPGPEWVGLGTYGTRTGWTQWNASMYWWQVRGGMRPTVGPGSSFTSFRLLVFRDTAGIGRARTGVAMAPVQAGGGVVAIGVEPSSAGSLTILPGTSGPVAVGWGAASSEGVFGNAGWSHSHTRAYELLPPSGPAAPLILAPGDGEEVTGAEPVELQWQHRPVVAGGRQDAFQVRAWDDTAGVELFWNASTQSWTAVEFVNVSAVQGVSLPANASALNVSKSWQARTREAVDGRWSVWSGARSFTPVVPPSVSVTGPSDIHDDLSPVVSWDATTPRGVQTAFRVQITRLGTVVYDSGAMPGSAGEWHVEPQDWVNGALYQARVQVQQSGGAWSSWSTRDFTLSWTPPAVPVVHVWPDRTGVLVQVASQPGLTVELERITPQGLWVRAGAPFVAGGAVTMVRDVFAPYGITTAYRARSANVLDGMPLVSDWGLSGPVKSKDRYSYLAAAGDPLTTWVRLLIREDGAHVHQRPTAVAYGLGDTDPHVSYGPLRGRAGSMSFASLTRETTAELLGLLHAGESLYVRWPAEMEDTGPGYVDAGTLTFDVAAEVDVARLAQVAFQRRTLAVAWVEQTTTIGGGTFAPATHPIEGVPVA